MALGCLWHFLRQLFVGYILIIAQKNKNKAIFHKFCCNPNSVIGLECASNVCCVAKLGFASSVSYGEYGLMAECNFL